MVGFLLSTVHQQCPRIQNPLSHSHTEKEASVAKVFGIHIIELLPGVKAKDFEEFVIEEMYPLNSPFAHFWREKRNCAILLSL